MKYRMSLLIYPMLLSGCLSLDPDYQRPAAPVPTTWPTDKAQADVSELTGWQQVIDDHRLTTVVEQALRSNRDLRKAIADIEAARAQYGEERAALFPTLNAELDSSRSRTLDSGVTGSADAGGSISSFEVDLFGRNRSLTREYKELWLASAETARSTRLTLIAETATAWFTLAADKSNLQLTRETMQSAGNTLRITQARLKAGVASATDVSEAMTTWQAARASEASYRTLVQQDINALNLLVGEPLPDELLPDSLDSLAEQTIKLVPAGVSSAVLLRRPDVLEAEHNLKSVNASIGAARASFFPSVTLTASAGTASSSLSNLFSGGSRIWSFAPSVTLPLFAGGSNLAALHYAEAEKKGYVATYEKTIQTAFSEVADALARRATLSDQLDAQQGYVAAAGQSQLLALRSYQSGVGDYLSVLTAQRTLWAAQLELITLKQTDFNNRITLWQTLGGGIG